MSQKLASFGRVRGLVFGAYGEASEDVHHLVHALADSYGGRTWAHAGFRDPDEARASAARKLYRSWGLMAMRANARLKLFNLTYVGQGAATASLQFRTGNQVSAPMLA